MTRAIDHCIAAGRFPEAVALLESHQGDLLSTGSADAVLRWYTEIADRHECRVDSLLRVPGGGCWLATLPGQSRPLPDSSPDSAPPRAFPIWATRLPNGLARGGVRCRC